MNILFVPQYFYLSLPSLVCVRDKLSALGHSCVLTRLPNQTPISANEIFTDIDLQKLGWKTLSIPVVTNINYRKNFVYKMIFFLAILKNRKIIKQFILEQSPSVVIMGSDLGGLHHRIMLDICAKLKIPVIIFYTCCVPEIVKKRRSLPLIVKFFLRVCAAGRAITFDGDIPGSYTTNSKVLVASDIVKQDLINQGIAANRVNVVGDPADNTSVIRKNQHLYNSNNVRIQSKEKFVLYINEVLGDYYGEKYEIEIIRYLAKFCSKLFGVKLFIKSHPLESKEMLSGFAQIAQEYNHVSFDERFDLNCLLADADLVIGHFSKALIMAVKYGAPIACINLYKNNSGCFLVENESILQIASYKQIEFFLEQFFYNHDFNTKVKNACKNLSERFNGNLDSESVTKIVEEILRSIAYSHPIRSVVRIQTDQQF